MLIFEIQLPNTLLFYLIQSSSIYLEMVEFGNSHLSIAQLNLWSDFQLISLPLEMGIESGESSRVRFGAGNVATQPVKRDEVGLIEC